MWLYFVLLSHSIFIRFWVILIVINLNFYKHLDLFYIPWKPYTLCSSTGQLNCFFFINPHYIKENNCIVGLDEKIICLHFFLRFIVVELVVFKFRSTLATIVGVNNNIACLCPQADTCPGRKGNDIANYGRDHGTHARLHRQCVYQARTPWEYIDTVRSCQNPSGSVNPSWGQTSKLRVDLLYS